MNNSRVKELKIDEWIWGIFIVLSILNICGDELEKDFYITHNNHSASISKKIFTFTVFISLLIYLYLAYQRHEKVKSMKKNNQNTNICQTRYFASILVVIASILLFYCQLNDKTPTNPTIV